MAPVSSFGYVSDGKYSYLKSHFVISQLVKCQLAKVNLNEVNKYTDVKKLVGKKNVKSQLVTTKSKC